VHDWIAAWRHRDPRQARFVTLASLRWMIRQRAWTPWYLIRYWRFFWLKLRRPDIVTEGLVFLGRRVQLYSRPGYGRIVLGRWVHFAGGNALRAHEGTLHVGDKVVFGTSNTVNCYLDVEIGAATIVADWIYICDFDHRFDDVHRPIKDQGIVKSPVRIGPDCWLGTKVTVLRGARVGEGCVLAAHAVVRGEVPAFGVAVGIPARVVRDRLDDYAAANKQREAIADIARKTERAAAGVIESVAAEQASRR
jgi:acetyltransferase-like isoleucine patch superfamily enzyme